MAQKSRQPLIQYNKQPLSYYDQIMQLEARGLHVPQKNKLAHLLETIGYYRLSRYWHALLENKLTNRFFANASFDKAFELYKFDCKLRALVLKELEKIEVAVRAKMVYVLSHDHGIFWYTDPDYFNDLQAFNDLLKKFNSEFTRSDQIFIRAYKQKYSDPLPPSWMMMEITSFGSLSKLFKNLKPEKPKREIAHFFGLDNKTFESWLHTFIYVRNICAHHSRLWNRELQVQPKCPINPNKTWLTSSNTNRKMFYILSMILYFLNTINPKTTFPAKLQRLLLKFPHIPLKAMGFPPSWLNEPLWANALPLKPGIFTPARYIKQNPVTTHLPLPLNSFLPS